MVIGISGAGKTTLSRRLAAALSLPLIELDLFHWQPGWQGLPSEEWRDRVRTLVDAEEWVMDGNYSGTFDIRMPRAQAIVWLDYEPLRCIRRVAVRTVGNWGRPRAGLPEGCPERFDPEFLRYIWGFRKNHRPKLERALADFGGNARLFRLTRDSEWERLVASLTA